MATASGTNNLYNRFMRLQGGGSSSITPTDSQDDLVSTPSAGPRLAAGTATMVTGTVTIATGLANVVAFFAEFNASGAGTGTSGNQQIIGTITTGSVLATAFYVSAIGASGAIAAASGSTGTFSWLAFGS